MDISEQCNKSIEEQIELFNSIKPLFTNKPIIICVNKIDILKMEELPDERRIHFKQFEDEGKYYHLLISSITAVENRTGLERPSEW